MAPTARAAAPSAAQARRVHLGTRSPRRARAQRRRCRPLPPLLREHCHPCHQPQRRRLEGVWWKRWRARVRAPSSCVGPVIALAASARRGAVSGGQVGGRTRSVGCANATRLMREEPFACTLRCQNQELRRSQHHHLRPPRRRTRCPSRAALRAPHLRSRAAPQHRTHPQPHPQSSTRGVGTRAWVPLLR